MYSVEKASGAMIVGLHIKIRGEELSWRMAERMRAREEAIAALDRRIAERAGDHLRDVRVEDGFTTVEDLEDERQTHRDVLLRLTLVRNSLSADEVYVLSMADLRTADLISARTPDEDEWSDVFEPSAETLEALSRP